jgi:Holliday junction resolvasome RuvABC DNA-binding subunit
VADEDVARLVSLGYDEKTARDALQHENTVEKAAQTLAAYHGVTKYKVNSTVELCRSAIQHDLH